MESLNTKTCKSVENSIEIFYSVEDTRKFILLKNVAEIDFIPESVHTG